jgi:hypothetical protein
VFCEIKPFTKKFAAKMKEKKMANKKQVWGILAVMLAFTMVIAGCSQDDDDDENTDPKKITITGLSGQNGNVVIAIVNDEMPVAVGIGTIGGDSVTVSLKIPNDYNAPTDNDWTGTGSFIVWLYVDGSLYIYTNGADLNDANSGALPKYNITSAVSTIPFDKFKQ